LRESKIDEGRVDLHREFCSNCGERETYAERWRHLSASGAGLRRLWTPAGARGSLLTGNGNGTDEAGKMSEHTPETGGPQAESAVDPKLLEILVCPLTKGPLDYDAANQELISRQAKLAYPIRDGIPIMLPDEARRIDE
jgi:uncharacterized protein YbaR (Trm112 family)